MPFRTLTQRITLSIGTVSAAVLSTATLTAAGPAANASAAALPVNYDFLAGAAVSAVAKQAARIQIHFCHIGAASDGPTGG